MRIVSGTLGSRRIETLPGDNTRPTSDKIRASIFNKIGPYFQEGSFLDVFGGSGAMAFEALSRGMSHATIIEMSHKAHRVILNNAKSFALTQQTHIIKGDSKRVIMTLNDAFDIVFMDPPYAYEHTENLMKSIIDQNLIKKEGWLIIETDPKKELLEAYKGWHRIDVKDYKATHVHYYVYE